MYVFFHQMVNASSNICKVYHGLSVKAKWQRQRVYVEPKMVATLVRDKLRKFTVNSEL